MIVILERYRDMPVTLCATEDGHLLCEQLDFRGVSVATWWVSSSTAPDGDGTPGRQGPNG